MVMLRCDGCGEHVWLVRRFGTSNGNNLWYCDRCFKRALNMRHVNIKIMLEDNTNEASVNPYSVIQAYLHDGKYAIKLNNGDVLHVDKDSYEKLCAWLDRVPQKGGVI